MAGSLLRLIPFASRTRQVNPFVEEYQHIAAHAVAAAEQLKAGFQGQPEQALERICQIEHLADQALLHIHRLVDRTFITPYDKRDVVKLANRLDDIVDSMRSVARAVVSYRVMEAHNAEALAQRAIAMCDVVVKSTRRLKEVVDALPGLDHDGVRAAVREIDELEDEGDEKLSQAIRAVFVDPNQPLTAGMLAWRDIFRLLEQTTDDCGHAISVILSIARQEGN